jgi:hypothetical protein
MLAATGMLAGCNSTKPQPIAEWDDNARRDTNEWLMRTYFSTQVDNAVIRHRTIYEHHFVEGSAALTPRGDRDIAILARYYNRHDGGTLLLPRGDADDALYGRRLAVVESRLRSAGVDLSRVSIEDGLWAGQTAPSIRAGADYARPSSDTPFSFHDQGDN